MARQRTIREKATCSGIGLHSGKVIKLEVLPAPENSGIVIVRTDVPHHPEIKVCIENTVDTTLATTLGVRHAGTHVTVATVEHLLAALSGMGIDNMRILLDGPEVPIMDGSSGPFVDMLLKAGVEEQRALRRYLVITKDVRVKDGDKEASISPGGPGLRVTCTLDFNHPLISSQPFKFDTAKQSFVKELAYARTFGFLHDVEILRKRGLALGGSLDNAIVIDQYRVLNEGGLRYPDEFVRHKLLDAIGDLSLFGMPIVGRLRLHRSGHALNTRLVTAVLSDPKAFRIVEPASPYRGEVTHDESSTITVLDAAKSVA